jgi:hypothetical protein
LSLQANEENRKRGGARKVGSKTNLEAMAGEGGEGGPGAAAGGGGPAPSGGGGGARKRKNSGEGAEGLKKARGAGSSSKLTA